MSEHVRIVIYPLFQADEEQTELLLDDLSDVLVKHHDASADADDCQSIIVFEDADGDVGSEEWAVALATSGRVRCVVLPGAADDDFGEAEEYGG